MTRDYDLEAESIRTIALDDKLTATWWHDDAEQCLFHLNCYILIFPMLGSGRMMGLLAGPSVFSGYQQFLVGWGTICFPDTKQTAPQL